jgi:hypothetical protein
LSGVKTQMQSAPCRRWDPSRRRRRVSPPCPV